MGRGRKANALALLVVIGAAACGDSSSDAAVSQCSLLDRADVEAVTSMSASEPAEYEHEESGDGTWCLYEIDGRRFELQFGPGGRAAFDEARTASISHGAVVSELDGIGDAAFFTTDGIARTMAFVDGHTLVVQSLDLAGIDAEAPTTELVRAAAENCCLT